MALARRFLTGPSTRHPPNPQSGQKTSPSAAMWRFRLSPFARVLPAHLDAAEQLFVFPFAGCGNQHHHTCCAGDGGSAPTSRMLCGMQGSSIEPFYPPICAASSFHMLLVSASTLMLGESRQGGIRLIADRPAGVMLAGLWTGAVAWLAIIGVFPDRIFSRSSSFLLPGQRRGMRSVNAGTFLPASLVWCPLHVE